MLLDFSNTFFPNSLRPAVLLGKDIGTQMDKVRYPAVVTNDFDAVRAKHHIICTRQRRAQGPLAGQGRSRGLETDRSRNLEAPAWV